MTKPSSGAGYLKAGRGCLLRTPTTRDTNTPGVSPHPTPCLPFYFLMDWAEAFATGMMVTLMVVYRPEWVATFDDARYLGMK
jgi:uncharacterized membrane protein